MVSAAVAAAVACLHQHPQDCGYTCVTLRRLAEGEKTNGRWAMMAVLGIMGQDLLGVQPAWYLHGEKVKQLHTHIVHVKFRLCALYAGKNMLYSTRLCTIWKGVKRALKQVLYTLYRHGLQMGQLPDPR